MANSELYDQQTQVPQGGTDPERPLPSIIGGGARVAVGYFSFAAASGTDAQNTAILPAGSRVIAFGGWSNANSGAISLGYAAGTAVNKDGETYSYTADGDAFGATAAINDTALWANAKLPATGGTGQFEEYPINGELTITATPATSLDATDAMEVRILYVTDSA